MKNSDEAIDKVLQGLGNTKAPTGMGLRILRRMEDQAAARAERSVPAWKTRRLALSGLALAAIILIVVGVSRHTKEPPRQLAMEQPSPRTKVSYTAPEVYAPPSAKPASPKSVHHREPQAHATQDTKEASYPAPPMPLTHQERLLLKLAHQGDPEELATLTHDGVAIESAAEKADFKNFFGPPAKGDHE